METSSTERLKCRRAVVVAAGPEASSRLLMHSGVGDPEQLLPHGITVSLDLPALGRRVFDHPTVFYPVFLASTHLPRGKPKYQVQNPDFAPLPV